MPLKYWTITSAKAQAVPKTKLRPKSILKKPNIKNKPISYTRSARGMALVAVIFIMVIMSGAVLMMSRMADMQAAERTMDLLGARAEFAAQAGLEWAMYQIFANPGCPTSPSTITMHSETDLAGFSVNVTCVARPYTEGLNSVIIYDVQSQASTANFSATGEYVYRQLSAVVELDS